jgi:hypothetical protein
MNADQQIEFLKSIGIKDAKYDNILNRVTFNVLFLKIKVVLEPGINYDIHALLELLYYTGHKVGENQGSLDMKGRIADLVAQKVDELLAEV